MMAQVTAPDAPPPRPPAPGGPDLFTLRAWSAAEGTLASGARVDDAVHFLQDTAVAGFGQDALRRLSAFLAADELGDLEDGALLDDEPRLQRLLGELLAGGDALPEPEHQWWASAPGDGRRRLRR